jgi:hypothetical protein
MKSKVVLLSLLTSLPFGAQAGDAENIIGGVVLGAVIASQFSNHSHSTVQLSQPQYVYPPQVVFAPPVTYYPPQVIYSSPQIIYSPPPVYSFGPRHYRDQRGHGWRHEHGRGRW